MVMFLNTADDPSLPVSLPAVVTIVEPGSLTDTVGRYYTLEYDDTEIDGQSLNQCDILSVLCKSCCVLLQEQVDAIRSTSLPTASLAYQWMPIGEKPFAQVRLMAYGSPTLPLTTIAEVHYFDANDDEVLTDGNQTIWDSTQPHFFIDIPESIPAEYPGGLYYCVITDSGGRSTVAATYVTLDDRLHELDKARLDETNLASTNQVNREVLEREATDVEVRSGGNQNPDFWGRDLNLYGVGYSLDAPFRPCVRITSHHLLIHADAQPALGAQFAFMTADSGTYTVTCDNVTSVGAVGDGMYLVCFAEVVPTSAIPIMKVLPPDYLDWITVIGLPGAIVSQDKKMGAITITELTDNNAEFDYSRDFVGPPDLDLVVGETGNPVVIFVDAEPILIGFRIDDDNKRCFTYGEYLNYVNAAIILLGECPPNILGTLVDAFFWNAVDWFNVRRRPQAETSADRTALGFNALAAAHSTAIENTAVGTGAGATITTGDSNTLIGHAADVLDATDENSIAIGAGVTGLGPDTAVIGASNQVGFYPRGSLVLGSDNAPRGLLDFNGTVATWFWNSQGTVVSHDYVGITDHRASDAAGGFTWHTGASVADDHAFVLAANGRVGIGVVAPTGKLDIVGSGGAWVFDTVGTKLSNNNAVGASILLDNNAAVLHLGVGATAQVDISVNLVQVKQPITVTGLATLIGSLTFDDTSAVRTITAGSTNGLKIGAGATDKLGFFGVAPVVQPGANVSSGIASAGGGTPVLDDSTFDGGLGGATYSINGLINRLKEIGLLT